MARPKTLTEAMVARFAPGTLARIKAAVEGDEAAADLVRVAVERELQRRERQPTGRTKPPPVAL